MTVLNHPPGEGEPTCGAPSLLTNRRCMAHTAHPDDHEWTDGTVYATWSRSVQILR